MGCLAASYLMYIVSPIRKLLHRVKFFMETSDPLTSHINESACRMVARNIAIRCHTTLCSQHKRNGDSQLRSCVPLATISVLTNINRHNKLRPVLVL
jgi:hypothetical protein